MGPQTLLLSKFLRSSSALTSIPHLYPSSWLA